MAKAYTFTPQLKSDECPAVPKSVTVYASSTREATEKLAKALEGDPNLDKEHPEFAASGVEEKPESKSVQRRKSSLSSSDQ